VGHSCGCGRGEGIVDGGIVLGWVVWSLAHIFVLPFQLSDQVGCRADVLRVVGDKGRD
jgi:hypothetical protein